MYWDYEDTHLLGVFSSQETAREKISSLVGTKYPFSKWKQGYLEKNFEIEEHDLDNVPTS